MDICPNGQQHCMLAAIIYYNAIILHTQYGAAVLRCLIGIKNHFWKNGQVLSYVKLNFNEGMFSSILL